MFSGMFIAAVVVVAQLGAAQEIERAVIDGIEQGIYPGGVVVVGTRERILLARGYGHFTWSPTSARPDPDSTLFDLASLTKVVATTTAAMLLVDAGRLELDRPVQDYLSGFVGEGKDQVTVRHLLEHRSGLRAFLPLDRLASNAAEARRLVLEEPLTWAPGYRVTYSDLNAMLLGWVVERAAGMPLDAFVAKRVFEPLGMREAQFRPPRSLRRRIAPVGLWRGHAIAGELHDQNAVRLGGVAGHAGLYATGLDLARYAQFLLRRAVTADGHPLITPRTFGEFMRRGPENRALGWEVNDTTTTENTGGLLTAEALGHTGYTGTSLWIDPPANLFVVLLTNRVFAPRTRGSIGKLKDIRARVADGAVQLQRAVCAALDRSVVTTPC